MVTLKLRAVHKFLLNLNIHYTSEHIRTNLIHFVTGKYKNRRHMPFFGRASKRLRSCSWPSDNEGQYTGLTNGYLPWIWRKFCWTCRSGFKLLRHSHPNKIERLSSSIDSKEKGQKGSYRLLTIIQV